MTKLSMQETSISRKMRLRVKCGACMGLKRKMEGFQAPCQELGKSPSSAGCDSFTPNYSHVRACKPQLIQDVGLLLRDIPEHIKHLVAYAIVNETEMTRVTEAMLGVGLKLSHPVAVNLSAPRADFVNCWFSGFAMGITADRESLIICGKIETTWAHIVMPLNSGSIMTAKQWKTHKRSLVKAGKINADNKLLQSILPRVEPKKVEEENYVPMSLVKASEKLRNKHTKVQVKTTYKVRKTESGKVITL